MTHEQAHALLLDLAYGELAPGERTEVARHAAECSACAAELERISGTRAALARLGEGPTPSRGRGELVEAARRAVARRPTRRWFARPAALSFGAAAAVVAIVAGVTLQLAELRGRRTLEETPLTSPEPAQERSFAAPPPPSQAVAPAPTSPEPPKSPLAPQASPPAGRPAPRPGATASDAAAAGTRAEAKREAEPSSAPAAPVASAAPPSAVPPSAPPSRTAAPPAMAAPRAFAPGRAEERASAPAAARKSAERREAASAETEAAPSEPGDGSDQVIEDVERRLAAGELAEERRQLRCGDATIDRIALVAPGGRIVKLSERRGLEAVQEAWYDAAGHLRAARTAGGEAGAGRAAALPRRSPSLASVATACTW
jgi:putative zinc finger protein